MRYSLRPSERSVTAQKIQLEDRLEPTDGLLIQPQLNSLNNDPINCHENDVNCEGIPDVVISAAECLLHLCSFSSSPKAEN